MAGSALAAVVFFAAGTPLHSADSNVHDFLVTVGWKDPPDALATRAADHFVQFLAVIAFIICLSFVFDIRARLFPKRAKAAVYWTPYEATHYMANQSKWGRQMRRWTKRDSSGVTWTKNVLFEAPLEFSSQAQREGTPIKVFGVPRHGGKSELIEHTFWMSHGLEPFCCLDHTRDGETSPQKPLLLGETGYKHVRIDAGGVQAAWPPVPRWLRLWDKVVGYVRRNQQAL